MTTTPKPVTIDKATNISVGLLIAVWSILGVMLVGGVGGLFAINHLTKEVDGLAKDIRDNTGTVQELTIAVKVLETMFSGHDRRIRALEDAKDKPK